MIRRIVLSIFVVYWPILFSCPAEGLVASYPRSRLAGGLNSLSERDCETER